MSDNDILFERRGKLGLITLNRPTRLSALTHGMLLRLERQLVLWRDDDAVEVVAIQGAGERAFSARRRHPGTLRAGPGGRAQELQALCRRIPVGLTQVMHGTKSLRDRLRAPR